MTKRLLLALVATLSLLSVSSCDLSEKIIELGVQQAKATCPKDIGDGLTMADVQYSGGYVTYVYQCDAYMYDYDTMMVYKEESKESILEELMGQAEIDKDVEAFLSALRKSQIGLIYQYYVSSNDTPVEIQIEYDEL